MIDTFVRTLQCSFNLDAHIEEWILQPCHNVRAGEATACAMTYTLQASRICPRSTRNIRWTCNLVRPKGTFLRLLRLVTLDEGIDSAYRCKAMNRIGFQCKNKKASWGNCEFASLCACPNWWLSVNLAQPVGAWTERICPQNCHWQKQKRREEIRLYHDYVKLNECNWLAQPHKLWSK